MQSQETRTAAGRAEMALVGAFAGLALWALIYKLPDVVAQPQAYVAITSIVAGFFGVLLGMSGPYKIRRAAFPALCLSLVAGVFLTWSSVRFVSLDAFSDAIHPIVAWVIFLVVGTPFAAALLRDHHGLRDYAHLFDVSWSILVRFSAGWLFSGVFWAVLLLSDALLKIAGLTFIDDLLDHDPMPYLVTGVSLGVGLSVVHEMRAYLSPFLVLRLLRLLVPVLLVVVVIFVVAVFLQDPRAMFGSLSRAATLLAVALAMVSLVSIALDRSDADAVAPGWMRMATAALAVLTPVLAGLAVYALVLRVAQYGWTPSRLMAAVSAAIATVYGLFYLGSVFLRGPWMARIRQVNIRIAVLILLVSAAWQTPLLNAEWLSTRSQVARILNGTVSAENAALWEMTHDWGTPGRAGISQLSDLNDAEHVDLHTMIRRAQSAEFRFLYLRDRQEETRAELTETLVSHLHVPPGGEPLTAKMMEWWPKKQLRDLRHRCQTASAPGCVVVLGEFTPSESGLEGAMFIPTETGTYDVYSLYTKYGKVLDNQKVSASARPELGRNEVQGILDGDYEIAPSSRKSLWVNGKEVFPGH